MLYVAIYLYILAMPILFAYAAEVSGSMRVVRAIIGIALWPITVPIFTVYVVVRELSDGIGAED